MDGLLALEDEKAAVRLESKIVRIRVDGQENAVYVEIDSDFDSSEIVAAFTNAAGLPSESEVQILSVGVVIYKLRYSSLSDEYTVKPIPMALSSSSKQ
eukprot:4686638-Amphidinium_carterae.1